jgi:hypothetical protein
LFLSSLHAHSLILSFSHHSLLVSFISLLSLTIILSDYYSLLVSFISPCALFYSLIHSSFSPLFISLISLSLCRLQQAGAEDEGLASYGAAQAEAATNVFHMVAIYDFTQAEAWAVELVLMELTGPLRSRGLFTRLRLGRWSWC